MLSLLVVFPVFSTLKLQTSGVDPEHDFLFPETNLNTPLSVNMKCTLRQAPSEKVKAAYKGLLQDCIADHDTVFVGIYHDEEFQQLRIRHVQTSLAGHAEHMIHVKQGSADLMINTLYSEGMVFDGVDMGGPQSYLNDPALAALVLFSHGGVQRKYTQLTGKQHRFTPMNHEQTSPLSLVMLDPVIKLPSGLNSTVNKLIDEIVARAKEAPHLTTFDVLYRAEDQALTFREIYSNALAAREFRESIRDLWRTLLSLGTVSQEIAGPASEIDILKDLWTAEEVQEQSIKYFKLYDGFQRVHIQL